ncbi:MAG: UDP-N-acetylenolpyruvoylglucosamine reductase [Chlamydiae bacterium]|nr:UDP-N-acetylenolpyruvoylglucosamine reductase [Chlamydiota bacterium]
MTLGVKLQRDKLLSEVCTIGIGGPAAYYIEVHSIEKMQEAILFCHEKKVRYLILGKGSNTVFDDRGFHGVVIHNMIDFFNEQAPGVFHVGAGYNFSLLGAQTARKGWSGLEFASGIPGTVGGAIFMNAGANGMETCDSLTSVEFITEEGTLLHLNKKELLFSYRFSSFHQMSGAIVGATFTLTPSETARTQQLEIINYRKLSQPYGKKSAGCMFRNPHNNHAGALIEQCGLKGTKIGGVQVSDIHANFIINIGGGKCSDVVELLEFVKERVREKTGIELESEVRFISYE